MNYILFIFLGVYIFSTLVLLISHIFTGKYLQNFNNEVNKYEKIWLKIWKDAKEKHNGIISQRRISMLKDSEKIIAFLHLLQNNAEDREAILEKNADGIIKKIKKADKLTQAFFAYLLSISKVTDSDSIKKYSSFLSEMILKNSVHLRENSLKALYNLGNEAEIIKALSTLSENNITHEEKLVSDGLLNFNGDIQKLTDEFMKEFDRLSDCYKDAFATYLSRTDNHNYDDRLCEYMLNSSYSADVQCAILRLISMRPDNKSCDSILKYIETHMEDQYWESIAVAAKALGNYKHSAKIVALLSRLIKSKNWYIRMNSAQSLYQIGISDEEIEAILNCGDVYAADALRYSLRKEVTA